MPAQVRSRGSLVVKITDSWIVLNDQMVEFKINAKFRYEEAFNEILCDARELADEIEIPANFELTQPRHTVRRRNVNFDYERRDDPKEDPTLKYKAEFIFSQ
ncbi:uncharacterized protein TNCV_2062041 [Trichonephila clavipes]|nr:uncharacterized protein TNCV_2062041 [Trichonephila clavipes]